MRVIALDFDGVVCDSRDEVLVVALATFADLRPEARLVRERAARCDGDGFEPALPGDDPVALAFDQLMPLGNRAEDFGVALEAIEGGLCLGDQESYDRFRASLDPGSLHHFHDAFYRRRVQLRIAAPERWARLHRSYRPFVDRLGRLAAEATLALATAKDGASARRLLARFGVAELFRDDLVLDKEAGEHKTAHLTRIAERTGRSFAEISFLDDKVNHLEKVAPLGVRGVLAGWGYNTAREHERAARLGFAVATFETAEGLLLAP